MGLRNVKTQAVQHITATPTSLSRNQTGIMTTNKGASGAVTIKLPSGSQQGDTFDFFVDAAQTLIVNPTDSTDVIILGGVAGTAGHGVQSATAGDAMRLLNIGSGQWIVIDVVGTHWVAN